MKLIPSNWLYFINTCVNQVFLLYTYITLHIICLHLHIYCLYSVYIRCIGLFKYIKISTNFIASEKLFVYRTLFKQTHCNKVNWYWYKTNIHPYIINFRKTVCYIEQFNKANFHREIFNCSGYLCILHNKIFL